MIPPMNIQKNEEFEKNREFAVTPAIQPFQPLDVAKSGILAADARREQRRVEELKAETLVFWKMLEEARVDLRTARRAKVVTMDRCDRAHVAFDILRTNTLQEIRRNRWTSIGITSPTPNCGTSLVALNLAFSLQHQEDVRTVLMDMNLREPQLAHALGLPAGRGMAEFLKGGLPAEAALKRHGQNLALGLGRGRVEYAAEVLHSANTANSLLRLRQKLAPDVILYDLPPALTGDEVAAFSSNLDCVLIVARAETSRLDEIDMCERLLAEKTNVLGVVLNDCRFPARKFGY